MANRTHTGSQWLATPSSNKSLRAGQFFIRLLHLRVFRFHCAEEPEMWDFNWDIFLGLLACGAFKFGVTGPPTLWYSGSAFEPKASSHLFAATSFVSKYQVATEVLTAVAFLPRPMPVRPSGGSLRLSAAISQCPALKRSKGL